MVFLRKVTFRMLIDWFQSTIFEKSSKIWTTISNWSWAPDESTQKYTRLNCMPHNPSPLGLVGFGLVTMMEMMTMVAGEKEAVWIHHDQPAAQRRNAKARFSSTREHRVMETATMSARWIPDHLGNSICFIIYIIKFMAYQHLGMVLNRLGPNLQASNRSLICKNAVLDRNFQYQTLRIQFEF